ncbi:unnamed protein product [Toxocara canis]|uniref:Uncharacterized protein n=1 Tax=Toxocara canis TaxID=6265 RepID=A0A183UUD7_TOXCA|nr:unnamed protein product [Toxocara canis]
MLWALWNSQVEEILPEIDQNAILEYYEEKRIEKLSNQGFFARIWNIIKGWFRKESDEHHCYANDPGCIRAVIDGLRDDERRLLEDAVSRGNLSEVTKFVESKLCTVPPLYEEYHRWHAQNDVPHALRDITLGLTYAQKRAMDKLRRLELTDAIKDYYRGRIERRTAKEQQKFQEIEEFIQRMNKTFARCYNPRRIKSNLRK